MSTADAGDASSADTIDDAMADVGPEDAGPLPMLGECWSWSAESNNARLHDFAIAGDRIVAAGGFTGPLQIGEATYESGELQRGFVSLHGSESGSVLWSREFASTADAHVYGVGIAADGALFAALTFTGSIDLAGDSYSNIEEGGSVAVLRLSPDDGSVIWVRQFQSQGSGPQGNFVLPTESGQLVVVGSFFKSLTIDADTELDAGSSVAGPDNWVANLSAGDGSIVWGLGFGGGDGFDEVYSVARASGSIFLGGTSRQSGEIDSQISLSRVDERTGTLDWMRIYSRSAPALIGGLLVDGDRVITTGRAEEGADLGLGMVAGEGRFGFLASYSAGTGDPIEASTFPTGSRSDFPRNLLDLGAGTALMFTPEPRTATLDPLEEVGRWELPSGSGLFEFRVLRLDERRILIGGRAGTVVGNLQPAIRCLVLPE